MEKRWAKFVLVFAATALAGLAAAAVSIALIDPLAISPLRIVSNEILPQTNRRFIAPVIVRSGRFDSYVVGTSTAHTLDPQRLQGVLQGRFANVTLMGSTPYEQARLVSLIARNNPRGGRIVWGLDRLWCGAAPQRYGPEIFPEWLYDDSGWDHLVHSLNLSMLDLARRKLRQAMRPKNSRLRFDGYLHLLPPDAGYQVAKAQKLIYGTASPRALEHSLPVLLPAPNEANQDARGVALMRATLASLPDRSQLVLVLMPEHAFGLPSPGSPEERDLEHCKSSLAGLARQRGDWVIDAMWRSPWTVDDQNYWDGVHFRDRLADALIEGIGQVLNKGTGSPPPSLRILAHGR